MAECINCCRTADRPHGLCRVCYDDDSVRDTIKARLESLRGPADDRACLPVGMDITPTIAADPTDIFSGGVTVGAGVPAASPPDFGPPDDSVDADDPFGYVFFRMS